MLDFFMRHWALTGCAAFSLFGFLLAELKERSGLKALSTQDAVRLINDKNAFILDVRSAKEIEVNQKRSIKHAMHVPLGSLLGSLDSLKKHSHKPALIVCAKGDRAHAAWSMLKAAGFTEMYTLEGGIYAWQEAGLPTSPLNATKHADKQIAAS